MGKYNALIRCRLECCMGCVNYRRSDSYCTIHEGTISNPWGTKCGWYEW